MQCPHHTSPLDGTNIYSINIEAGSVPGECMVMTGTCQLYT